MRAEREKMMLRVYTCVHAAALPVARAFNIPGSFDATLCIDEPYEPYEPSDMALASRVIT